MRPIIEVGEGGRDAPVQHPDCDDLASLPACHVPAVPARPAQVASLTRLAARSIPTLSADRPVVERVHQYNPESVWAVTAGEDREIGVFAMLILNRSGLRALLADDFDSANPDLGRLVKPGEEAAAIYLWAIVTPGLAIETFRIVSRWLQSPTAQSAGIFARPTTKAGLRLSVRLGFEPIPELSLYCFRRHCNRREASAVA